MSSVSLSNLKNITTTPNLTTISSSGVNILGFSTIDSSLTVSGLIKINNNDVMLSNNISSAGHSVLFEPIACQSYQGDSAGISSGIAVPIVANFAIDGENCGLAVSSGVRYDFWRTYVNLVAGTYSLAIEHGTGTMCGQVTVVLNGSTLGTIETYYNPGNNYIISYINSISVDTNGVYKLELQVNNKNVSSTGFKFFWRRGGFIRTA